MAEERPLTDEQRKETIRIVLESQTLESVEEVIETEYKGDRDAYWRAMAKWLGIFDNN